MAATLEHDERDERDQDDEAVQLDERRVVRGWPRYALALLPASDDEELWSLRDGALWYAVAARLPLAMRRGLAQRHAAEETRLWSALLAAAERCGAASAGTPLSDKPADGVAAGDASQARWALARALRAYRRAGTPPRAAIPTAVGAELVARWQAGGRRCGICGAAVAADDAVALDHVRPVSRGGGDTIENLRVAHARCNARRAAWQWDGDPAALRSIHLRLEPAHPSLGAAFACWYCGTPTRGYVDVDGLPTFRFCDEHRGWQQVRALLAGHGVPPALLDQATYLVTPA